MSTILFGSAPAPFVRPYLKSFAEKHPVFDTLNSAAKNYFKNPLERFKTDAARVKDGLKEAYDSLTSSEPTYESDSSARGVSQAPLQPQTVDYLNADLAKHYGLGASTAYQEALSNTAYQRAVKDMKAAGLNPAAIFGAGKGYTAGGVSYVESGGSNSSGAVVGSGSKDDKLFSEAAYHGISTAVGLATMAVMKRGPIGFYIGQTAAKAVLGTVNEVLN